MKISCFIKSCFLCNGGSDNLHDSFSVFNKLKSVWCLRSDSVSVSTSNRLPPQQQHLSGLILSSLSLVPGPSGQVVQCGHEDQGDFFVSSSQQRKHPLGELGGSVEAVDLWSWLNIVKGDLTLLHVQEDADLTQLWRTLHLQEGQRRDLRSVQREQVNRD